MGRFFLKKKMILIWAHFLWNIYAFYFYYYWRAAIANHINVDAEFTAKQNKYESLIYQLEISKEDDSVDKYFLYSEIDNWNSELIKEKELSKNF